MGEQGVCGGVVALSKLTSICGMSHRWERMQPYPTLKLPVAHLEQEECDNAVEGDGNNEPNPMSHEEDVLLANCPTES